MSDPTSTPEINVHAELCEIRKQLAEMSEQFLEQRKIHSDLMELYENVKGFLTVLGWLERMTIFVTKVGAGGAILAAAYQFFAKQKGQ